MHNIYIYCKKCKVHYYNMSSGYCTLNNILSISSLAMALSLGFICRRQAATCSPKAASPSCCCCNVCSLNNRAFSTSSPFSDRFLLWSAVLRTVLSDSRRAGVLSAVLVALLWKCNGRVAFIRSGRCSNVPFSSGGIQLFL